MTKTVNAKELIDNKEKYLIVCDDPVGGVDKGSNEIVVNQITAVTVDGAIHIARRLLDIDTTDEDLLDYYLTINYAYGVTSIEDLLND